MSGGFCGPSVTAHSVDEGVLSNECFLNGLSMFPHATLMLIAIPTLIAWKKAKMEGTQLRSWVHFPCHKIRWILTLSLIILNIAEIGEGILSDSKIHGLHFHLYIPHMVALCGSVLSIVYYHCVESWNSPRFLLLLLLYWLGGLIIKALKVCNLFIRGLNVQHVRFDLTWDVIIIYFLLIIVELNVIRKLRYVLYKRPVVLQPPEELEKTKFVYSYVNFLSQCTFFWLNKMLFQGYKHQLQLEELGQLAEGELSGNNFVKLRRLFEIQKQNVKEKNGNKNPSLWRCYASSIWRLIGLAAIFKIIGDLLGFVGPLCISGIIFYIESDQGDAVLLTNSSLIMGNVTITPMEQYITLKEFFTNGYVLAFVMLIAILLKDTFLQSHHFLVYREGIRLKSAIQGMVYDKALRLSSWELSGGNMTQGKLINHISTDSYNIMFFCYFINYVWAMPIQLTITMVLLYQQLGYSALLAALLIVLLVPLQYKLGAFQSSVQKKILECADERLKYCNELLSGIKLLKLYAWETVFSQRIQTARKKEMSNLMKHACIAALTNFFMRGAPTFVMLIAFVLYPYLENQPLTAAKAFSSMALFDILTLPLLIFPLLVNFTVNAQVSTGRLLPYFMASEVRKHGGRGRSSTNDTNTWTNDVKIPQIKVDFDASSNKYYPPPSSEDKMSREPTPEPGSRELPTVEFAGRISREASPNPGKKLQLDDRKHSDGSSDLARSRESSPEVRSRQRHLSASRTSDSSDITDLTGMIRHRQPRSRKVSESDDAADKHSRHTRNRSSGQLSIASLDVLEEIETYDPQRGAGVMVDVQDGNFNWDPSSTEASLKEIMFTADAGKLTMIVGPVGSGKSSLLSALFGEMITLSGSVTFRKGLTVAYASQNPWLLNASLQDNILFGQQYDKKRYARVVRACALQPDIDILPAGDQTEIGEKGINLSGGQKQRISVARAMYSQSDLVILDDPLSALDAHVGAQIFEEGIKKFLLRRKRAVILVTHQLQYLHSAYQIYVMSEGMITHSGNLEEIKTNHPDLFETWRMAIQRIRKESESHSADESNISKERQTLQRQISSPGALQRQISAFSVMLQASPSKTSHDSARQVFFDRQLSDISDVTSFDTDLELQPLKKTKSNLSIPEQVAEDDITAEAVKKEEKGKLITEEERAKGRVACSVIASYMLACSIFLSVMVILLYLAANVMQMVRDFWLARWSTAIRDAQDVDNLSPSVGTNQSYASGYTHIPAANDTTKHTLDTGYYVRGYALLGGASAVITLIVSFTVRFAGLRASTVLHSNMLHKIIHLPMRFFDTTPLGRIVNRFSSDIVTIDERLPFSIGHLIQNIFMCSAAIIVNSISVPYFLLVALPLCIFYFFLQKFIRASTRELQRLDSITKSPVFAHFSETLGGLSTIRAFKEEKRFMRSMLAKIDANTITFLYLNTANRWLGIRLDHMGAFVVFASAVSSMTAALAGHINSGYVGLCIAYTLMMSTTLNWVIRMLTDSESQMNSVERIIDYTELSAEPDTENQAIAVQPSPDWPSQGCIRFEKVSLRYDESLDLVINGIDLQIEGGTKVGICGRTGSGKSSLTLALFRMIDICQGQIIIDDLDIGKVPLQTLRSRLSIIPQDPVLFAGTIRYNLDPTDTKTDEELWTALEIAQLKQTIEGTPEKLEYVVSEGGENFSVGQRQLFCLARAFLRRVKILVMDEATASIDLETDAVIQQVIACAFKSQTILTIAHRVATIMDYDKVIVLDKGHIIENDSPQALLEQPDSVFSSFVKTAK